MCSTYWRRKKKRCKNLYNIILLIDYVPVNCEEKYLPKRHQSRAIRTSAWSTGKCQEENKTKKSRLVRGILRSTICHSKVDANGGCCRVIFRNGVRCTRIFVSGIPNHRKKIKPAGAGINKIKLVRPASTMVAARKPLFALLMCRALKIQTVQRTKGTTQAKKWGIKRHIVVDTQGLHHAIAVPTANVIDRQGALIAFSLNKETFSKVIKVLVDGGYTGQLFATSTQNILGASVDIANDCLMTVPMNLTG